MRRRGPANVHFLTTFDEAEEAIDLCDVLLGQGLAVGVRQGDHGTGVWVLDEAQLPRAQATLERYRDAPDTPALRALAEVGRKRREAHARERNGVGARLRQAPFTMACIAAAAAVYFASDGGADDAALAPLLIGTLQDAAAGQPYARLLAGELWRLWTPAFIHFGALHIFFNAWWMYDLGTAVERQQRSGFVIALVLCSAALSNLAQLALTGSPLFGGLSGVVYAVLGHVWLRGHFDPASGLRLERQTVVIMLGWMALGFAGFMRMANYAHLGGLLVGCVFGLLSARPWKRGAAT